MRREIPLAITVFVGFLLIVSVFFPPVETLGEDFSLSFDIIAVFAFFLGGGNLLRVHFTKLSRRKRDWQFSIVTIVGFFVMLAFGLFKLGNDGGISASLTTQGSYFQMVYQSIFVPLGSTMYALLAFFVASAASQLSTGTIVSRAIL